MDFLRCFLGFREIDFDFGDFEHHFRFDYGFYFFVDFADSAGAVFAFADSVASADFDDFDEKQPVEFLAPHLRFLRLLQFL